MTINIKTAKTSVMNYRTGEKEARKLYKEERAIIETLMNGGKVFKVWNPIRATAHWQLRDAAGQTAIVSNDVVGMFFPEEYLEAVNKEEYTLKAI